MKRRPYLQCLGGGLAVLVGGCSGMENEVTDTPNDTPSPSKTQSETSTPSDSPTPEETTTEESRSFSAEANWPQFQVDSANTGSHPAASGPTDDVTERWQYDIGKEASPPVVVDGTVYVGTEKEVIALNERDGSEVWRAPVNGVVDASPAVADGTVYVGTTNNLASAFDRKSGEKLWQVRTAPSRYDGEVGLTVSGGMVYVNSWSGVHALDAETGEKQWQSGGKHTPAVAGESVFIAKVGRDGEQISAHDSADGSERWTYTATKANREVWIPASPTVSDDLVYFGIRADNPRVTHSAEGRVYALSASNGTKQWQADTKFPVRNGAFDGETLFIGTVSPGHSRKGAVWALEPTSGAKRWRTDISGRISVPAVADGIIYVGASSPEPDDSSRIHALETSDGSEQWQVDMDGHVLGHPAVVNDTVYINDPSTVFALW